VVKRYFKRHFFPARPERRTASASLCSAHRAKPRFDRANPRFIAARCEARRATPRVHSTQHRRVRCQPKESIVFDRLFSAALAFCMLAGSAVVIATAMLEQPQARPAAASPLHSCGEPAATTPRPTSA